MLEIVEVCGILMGKDCVFLVLYLVFLMLIEFLEFID